MFDVFPVGCCNRSSSKEALEIAWAKDAFPGSTSILLTPVASFRYFGVAVRETGQRERFAALKGRLYTDAWRRNVKALEQNRLLRREKKW